jgi:chemotaxis protein MotB
MSGPRRRGRGASAEHHGADERWLLTYSDMITLLMCLFMVLWSISSVNISKLQELQRSLQQAFIGKVLDSGQSVLHGEGSNQDGVQQSQQAAPTIAAPAVISTKVNAIPEATAAQLNKAARQEQQSLRHVQQQIEAYARRHGFAANIRTTIDERGLVIRLLTDKVLFDSGQAVVKPGAVPLLTEVSHAILAAHIPNPIRVEGHTDNVPISGGPFRDNWELSAARATAVLEQFLAEGVPAARLSMAGYADQHPLVPNTTADGRALNRRVEVVVARRYTQGVNA